MLLSLGDMLVWQDIALDAKGSSTPGGAPVGIAAGNYDLEDLQAFGIGNDAISWIRVPTDLRVMVFEDAHFQGRRWILSSGDFDLVRRKDPDLYNWNDKISSLVVVPRSDVPSVFETPAAYVAFWDARTEQARAWYSQRETERQQDLAARQQEEALAAIREQAAQQAAAQAAQIESARLAAELQIALAEQRSRAARETVTTLATEVAAPIWNPEAHTIDLTPNVTAALPPVPRSETSSGTLLIVGVGALAAYLYKRSKNKGAS